jgi:hypothetical protein
VMITDRLIRNDGTKRFRLTDHEQGEIINKDLKYMNIKSSSTVYDDVLIIRSQTEEGEIIIFEVQYVPFRITMRIDGETLIVVNENDNLLFENYEKYFAGIKDG